MRRVLTIGSISQPTSCNQGQNFSIRCAAVPAPWKNQGRWRVFEDWRPSICACEEQVLKIQMGMVLLLPKEIIYWAYGVHDVSLIRNGESSSEEPKYVSQPPIMHIVAYCTVCNCPHGTSDLPNLGVQQDQVEQPAAGSRTHPARAKTH